MPYIAFDAYFRVPRRGRYRRQAGASFKD